MPTKHFYTKNTGAKYGNETKKKKRRMVSIKFSQQLFSSSEDEDQQTLLKTHIMPSHGVKCCTGRSQHNMSTRLQADESAGVNYDESSKKRQHRKGYTHGGNSKKVLVISQSVH